VRYDHSAAVGQHLEDRDFALSLAPKSRNVVRDATFYVDEPTILEHRDGEGNHWLRCRHHLKRSRVRHRHRFSLVTSPSASDADREAQQLFSPNADRQLAARKGASVELSTE
jgi:hypothetical protein